ncbi:MAG: hypothetical protein V3W31_02730, partial [Thermodesulfobacteriota bacterium]
IRSVLSLESVTSPPPPGGLPPEGLPDDVLRSIEIETKYEGYIRRQVEEAGRFKKMEGVEIPEGLSYGEVHGLSTEIREKLTRTRPLSLGQASRIPGVTPAAISMLMVHLRKIGPTGAAGAKNI